MDYVKYIRKKVGHSQIILNYSGCIIENNKGDILLQKRSDCNQWGFLGGVVELGESLEEAAIREVYEESGLTVEIDSLFGVYSKYFTEYKNGDKVQTILHMFIGHVKNECPFIKNDETLEIRYFNPKDVPDLFNDQHKDILSDIINHNKFVYR